jgi:hypothetical protein
MIRTARIYAGILLALCVLGAIYYFLSTGTSLALRAGVLVYCAALAVILLGLYGRGGRDLARVALVLSALWAVWGFVELAIWYFARPAGFTAVMAFLSASLFSVVPGTLCVLALRQLQRGAALGAPAQPAARA